MNCKLNNLSIALIFLIGAPQAMFHSCVTFAAFSCIMDGLNKQQAAMALTLDRGPLTDNHHDSGILPPFTLPPLMDARDALASFCQTLLKLKHETKGKVRS
jgi:mitochondrial import inner membrane translocase subunit TIM22